MEPRPDLSCYRLPEEQLRAIFATSILPADVPPSLPASPSAPPVALLAVGQTGAGKTRLAAALVSALRSAGRAPAHLIADTYKTHHPAFAPLLRDAPALASPATSDDARRWLAMAAEAAAARAVDVVLESACRHADDVAGLAAVFRRHGYRVEVAVLAVPAALSRLGILARFHLGLPEAQSRDLPPRLTPAAIHDASYGGLLAAARALDASGLADRVVVVRRGNLVAYVEEPHRHGAPTAGVAAAVQRERERPLTEAEARTAAEDMERLGTCGAAADQLEHVRALLEPLTGQQAEGRRALFPELRPLTFAKGGELGAASKHVLEVYIRDGQDTAALSTSPGIVAHDNVIDCSES